MTRIPQERLINSSWGSVFHASGRDGVREPSLFGFALRRHSDLYMSQLQSIAPYVVRRHRFVPPHTPLPHEVAPYSDPVVERIAAGASAAYTCIPRDNPIISPVI